MNKLHNLIVLLLIVNLNCVFTNDLKGFDDNIYFSLNWKGNDNLLERKLKFCLSLT